MPRRLENKSKGEYPFSSEIETMNIMKRGFLKANLTHMNDRSEPTIEAGSMIEVNGVVYAFDTEEAIQGDLSNHTGKVYIKTKREIVDEKEVLSVEYDTEKEPVWNNKKKGFYFGLDRYFSYFFFKDNVYQNKTIIYESIDNSGFEFRSISYDNEFVAVEDIVYCDVNKAFYVCGFTSDEVVVLKTIDGESYELMYNYSYDNTQTYTRHLLGLQTSNGGFYLSEYTYIGSTKSYYHHFSIDEESYSKGNFATTLQSASHYMFDGTHHYFDPYTGSAYVLVKYDGSTYDSLSLPSNTYGFAKIGDRVVIGGSNYCKYTDDFSTLNATGIDGLKTRIIQKDNIVYAAQPDDTYETSNGSTFIKRCEGTYIGGAYSVCLFENRLWATTSLGLYKEDFVSHLQTNYFETIIVRENDSSVTGLRYLFTDGEKIIIMTTTDDVACILKDGTWSIPHEENLEIEEVAIGLDMIMMKMNERGDVAIYRI